MTLLITLFAAIICTILWYNYAANRTGYQANITKHSEVTTGDQMTVTSHHGMYLGTLSLMYWGASIMWLVDAIYEYAELHEEYFHPAPADMLNDAFLGLSVVALGLIIWLIILIVKDPKGVVKAALIKQTNK